MSDSPTGEEKTPAQWAEHVLVLEMALKDQRESCEMAFSQRNTAEAKFIAIRAENDDLLEEAAHNAKQLAMTRRIAGGLVSKKRAFAATLLAFAGGVLFELLISFLF